MYDFHIHSEFSIDASHSMEDMVKSAIDKKLKCICFTDHIDLDSTNMHLDLKFIVDDYFKELRKVKYRYMSDIEILGGVELGLQPHLIQRYEHLVSKYNFDFVILSIHAINGMDIVRENIFQTYSQKEAIETYYNDLLYCVQNFKDYDVLGHIDFIDRYVHLQTDEVLDLSIYDSIYEQIAEILKIVIEDGKGIEVNTASLRHGLDYLNPKLTILEIYKELGGEILTLGSDAHFPKDVGADFRLAEKVIKSLGFKSIYVYRDRKKSQILL